MPLNEKYFLCCTNSKFAISLSHISLGVLMSTMQFIRSDKEKIEEVNYCIRFSGRHLRYRFRVFRSSTEAMIYLSFFQRKWSNDKAGKLEKGK